jgi:hypothetical protein
LTIGLSIQRLANEGALVAATYLNISPLGEEGIGHVAQVVADYSGPLDLERGPLIAQAGLTNGIMYASDGFGSELLTEIRYFWIPDSMISGDIE